MSHDKRNKEPELPPGADLEEDRQVVLPVEDDAVGPTAVSPQNSSPNSLASWQRQPAPWAVWLERLTLWLERPFNKLTGTPQLNPFYHTGTIAVLLTLVVGITGFYIFLFYKYGYDASYLAVLRMDDQFIARTMRAVHRYASGALVVTTLLHAYRTLFMERFRGQRWLAWVTGVVLTIIVWFAGVTGYWLVVDTRAQLINDGFVRFLRGFTPWADQFVLWLTRAEFSGETWPVMLILLAIHIALFLVVAYFFYLHIRRLNRAKWLPDMYLVIGTMTVLILVAIIFPLRNLPGANSVRLPESITLDPLFLFYLPTEGGSIAPWLWGGLLLITAVATILPWITRDRSMAETSKTATGLPVVQIVPENCTGCTLCALDCPYDALEMVMRDDESGHKFVALAKPEMCVSCGICVGSCNWSAITLGNSSPDLVWETIAMRLRLAKAKSPNQPIRLAFTCDRHAALGARPYLMQNEPVVVEDTAVEIVTVPCVGTLLPDTLLRALEAGAHDVQIIGCPPDDCRNREGNEWIENRLLRQRLPRLNRDHANAPIFADWVSPDDFKAALHRPLPEAKVPQEEPDFVAARRMFTEISPRSLVILFVMMVVVLLAQVFLTDLPFTSLKAGDTAVVRVMVENPVAAYDHLILADPERPLTLRLELDGDVLSEQTYDLATFASREADPFVAEHDIEPGTHLVRLAYVGEQTGEDVVLLEETKELRPGDIWRTIYEPRSFTKNAK
ncbi:MAG: hydrogenase iron-sulfur subunit [Ardenticatenaceae bacterium]|nr:hydrogenase iron-sulfur subunit [Anaerolineales bacterium]MCB8940853.1 hydrogenase iron-sulfur subunit [Ardenticatenaceae bacterium]MCB8972192.1 hydrogenase iron-sulfur subunit [Ardenticatenaceae bacterium]